MRQGALQKARRGELLSKVPTGYFRTNDQVGLDPDEQIQTFVRTIFTLFERFGSASAILRYLAQHGLQMPIRLQDGPDKGTVKLQRPHQTAICNILRHPMYTGAYVYGRRMRKKAAHGRGKKHRRRDRSEWTVLLRDRYPAYITWAQYERNVAQLDANASHFKTPGTVRSGRGLLTGLIMCGRCGARMRTIHGGENKVPRYVCSAALTVYGSPLCQNVAARPVDDDIARAALQALAPSALEVSLSVAADLQKQLDQAQALWQQRLERAHYEVDRARRQYEAVEPENRLVARTLEATWEEKLREERVLQEEHERLLQQQPRLLSPAEQDQIRRLAADLPVLWQSPTTTDADRKTILRQLIEKVVVTVEGETEWTEARTHWTGGHETYTRFRRRVQRLDQLSNWPQIREQILKLKQEGRSAHEIAEHLNREGFRTPHNQRFTKVSVRACLCRYGLSKVQRCRSQAELTLAPDEWYITDLAQKLDVSPRVIYDRIRDGKLEARQVGGSQGIWIVRADAEMCAQLSAHRRRRIESKTGNRGPLQSEKA